MPLLDLILCSFRITFSNDFEQSGIGAAWEDDTNRENLKNNLRVSLVEMTRELDPEFENLPTTAIEIQDVRPGE